MPHVPPAARRVPTPIAATGKATPRTGRMARTDSSAEASASAGGRKSFIVGLGIGIAVGAAVALLLAPQSGADTRRALRRRGRRVRNRAGDAWEDLRLELARAKRALRRKRREA